MKPSIYAAGLGLSLLPLAAHATAESTPPTMTTTAAAAQAAPAPDAGTTPPIAEQRPHSVTLHGKTLSDPWNWLRDQSYPKVDDADVLAYLNAENAYFEAKMAPHAKLVDSIFEEMKGRIKEDDASVPQKDGNWLYWVEYEKGAQYKKWYRKPVAGGEKQLILDEVALAKDKQYFRLGALSVSPNGNLLAFSVDDNGSERFELRVKDLTTGTMLPDVIPGTLSAIVWTSDNKGFLYGLANENWRTDNARWHKLGDDPKNDVVLYQEKDIGFGVGIGKTSSEKWLIIGTGDNETSEVRLLPADNPGATPILVAPRKKGREYSVDEANGKLYIHSNDTHVNFRLATATLDNPGKWTTLIPGSDNFYMTGVSLFKDFFVVQGREAGLDQIAIHSYKTPKKGERIRFAEGSYVAGLSNNPEFDTKLLRLSYESMVTPDTVYDYDVTTKTLKSLKVQEIPSGYDASQYVTERVMLPARDGTMVPASLLYKKGLKKDGNAPVHLYAYGAYGYAVPPGFSTTRLSLVDRGFIYAIAHIRGGDDLGRNWYLQGKAFQRKNTFTDFVDVAKGLISKGYTRPGRISAQGGSAGGQVMGVITNMEPQLWGAVIANVPFVDVINTMVDKTLPLTPGEWPEWGNPITDKKAFEYMLSYSPYDNVGAKAYPPIMITAGLNDPRVTYWEPAKWAAKLRANSTSSNLILLKTNMGAGHGGKSGRFDSLREDAEEFAFLITQLGQNEKGAK